MGAYIETGAEFIHGCGAQSGSICLAKVGAKALVVGVHNVIIYITRRQRTPQTQEFARIFK